MSWGAWNPRGVRHRQRKDSRLCGGGCSSPSLARRRSNSGTLRRVPCFFAVRASVCVAGARGPCRRLRARTDAPTPRPRSRARSRARHGFYALTKARPGKILVDELHLGLLPFACLARGRGARPHPARRRGSPSRRAASCRSFAGACERWRARYRRFIAALGRGDQMRHGGSGPDPRELPSVRARNIYDPYEHIDQIKLKTRDFR